MQRYSCETAFAIQSSSTTVTLLSILHAQLLPKLLHVTKTTLNPDLMLACTEYGSVLTLM